jgi:hypothetical protein
VKHIIKEIEAIFNRSGLTANIEIKELNIVAFWFCGCVCDTVRKLMHQATQQVNKH